MLALRAKTEAERVLAYAPILSESLFFGYIKRWCRKSDSSMTPPDRNPLSFRGKAFAFRCIEKRNTATEDGAFGNG
uniref:Uncharacterized protein n=1 Tax=Candidatus Kentrum sp. LFY TaxID=2126342 RepID=A0A450V5M0_9GAMM|nr:MAG: hypothetical protein BECKLFY1418B_GA0070995_11682 [Candidatus Kentron sp. LFY]